MPTALEVRRENPADARAVDDPPAAAGDGQVRLRIERFGLSANNVTYAVLGDQLRYWEFFPASEEGWGRVPAWGFARVVESRHSGLAEGARVFGYVPMAAEAVITAGAVTEGGFTEASPHRASLPGAYNDLRFVPEGTSDRDEAHALLRPLFMTAVVLARWLRGADRLVLSSASSKTALGTALLAARDGAEVVGLTSPRNVAFLEGLGLFERVVPYDALDGVPLVPATFVDLAGDAAVRAAVHHHLGGALQRSVTVGATHHHALAGPPGELPGPTPKFFFAPDHLRDGLGPDAFEAWQELLGWSDGWMVHEHRAGAEAALTAWGEVVAGALPPQTALSLAL